MYAALILGLAGSLHCVGMCGPLVLSLPISPGGRRSHIVQLLMYHAGRSGAYAALGAGFGLLGKGLAMAGLQQGLSIGAGIIMLVMAIFAWRVERLAALAPGFNTFATFVSARMARLLKSESKGTWLGLGALNGLLPCGMVYAALAGAIGQADWGRGALFMLLFGLGTAPLLIGVGLARQRLSPEIRSRLRIVQPILLLLAGYLLIHRGLSLDLSLFESAVPPAQVDCH